MYSLNFDTHHPVISLLCPKTFDVRVDGNFSVSSDCLSNNDNNFIYVQTKRSSAASVLPTTIDMARERDLEMLMMIKKQNLNVPDFVYCNDRFEYARYMTPGIDYLIKPFGQARSLGQMLVNKENFLTVLYDAGVKLSKEEFNKKYNIDTRTSRDSVEEYKCFDSLKRNCFYISKVIKYDHEFRVLYTRTTEAKDFIVEERSGYSVLEKDKERKSWVISNYNYKWLVPILEELKKLGDSHPSPILSFDVYVVAKNNVLVDKDINQIAVTRNIFDIEEWGLFECSTEMGLHYNSNGNTMNELSRQINNAFKYECERTIANVADGE